MFDLKKFLRIEISGYVCILYTALFTTCLFFLFRPGFGFEEFDSGFWYKGPIAAIPVALVLGFIIHQVSIRVLNPFCEYRTFFKERPALKALKILSRKLPSYYNNILKKVDKNGLYDALAGLPSKKNPSYSAYLRAEISRRYSYYYARMDAGIFAPILGCILSLITFTIWFLLEAQNCLQLPIYTCWARWIPSGVSIVFTVAVSLGVASYSGKLVREIDLLECALLAENYDPSFVKNVLEKYEKGIRKTR